jgi:GcrA cell cycle regulator
MSRDWTDDRIALLTKLWDDQRLSAAAIGRLMDIGKNAVVGKAHRLGLTARPSPIPQRPDGAPRPMRIKRIVPGAVTLAPLVVGEPGADSQPVDTAVVDTPPMDEPKLAKAAPKVRVRPCGWVDGPRGRLVECCEPRVEPGLFCAAHRRRGYTKRAPAADNGATRHHWGVI